MVELCNQIYIAESTAKAITCVSSLDLGDICDICQFLKIDPIKRWKKIKVQFK